MQAVLAQCHLHWTVFWPVLVRVGCVVIAMPLLTFLAALWLPSVLIRVCLMVNREGLYNREGHDPDSFSLWIICGTSLRCVRYATFQMSERRGEKSLATFADGGPEINALVTFVISRSGK
jgi:hypothetical protein